MDEYSKEFKEEYAETTMKILNKTIQKEIVKSSRKFLPKDFFDESNPQFTDLVFASFETLKKAENYIRNTSQNRMNTECFHPKNQELKSPYLELDQAFTKLANAQKSKVSMRVRIVKNAGLTVCPYCNRDYINCRAGNVSGAQLDHFFSRSKYPIFSISLYNLIPVCANCNRVKSAQHQEFASPFDKTIDWENEITFVYQLESLDHIKIDIKSENQAVKNNLKAMRIKEAYQIHELEVREILEKYQAYSKSQREEIKSVLRKADISDDEIKRIIFGSNIMPEDRKKKPLGKLLHDLQKELNIY